MFLNDWIERIFFVTVFIRPYLATMKTRQVGQDGKIKGLRETTHRGVSTNIRAGRFD